MMQLFKERKKERKKWYILSDLIGCQGFKYRNLSGSKEAGIDRGNMVKREGISIKKIF